MKRKVFLGGTCNDTIWRSELIPMLKVDYFNPVVEDWTPECQKEEQRQKDQECDVHLYVLTPRMSGVFSVAEIIESAHDKRVTTVVYIQQMDYYRDSELPKDIYGRVKVGAPMYLWFDEGQSRSLNAVCEMAKRHGAIICNSLEEVARTINGL